MRLLLDTRTLLWALPSPSVFPTSPVRPLKIGVTTSGCRLPRLGSWPQFRLGKLPQAQVLVLGYAEHLARLDAHELAVTSRHALDAGFLNWAHRDPFDRMLAAQAMVESITLVSGDSVFAEVPGVRILW